MVFELNIGHQIFQYVSRHVHKPLERQTYKLKLNIIHILAIILFILFLVFCLS